MTEPKFVKSSFCGSAACVEVSHSGGEVLVRDSKHPEQEPLVFTEDEWVAFLDGARAGEFDHRQATPLPCGETTADADGGSVYCVRSPGHAGHHWYDT